MSWCKYTSVQIKDEYMKNAIFPAGLVISEENLSFDRLKDHQIGWDLQCSQIEDGTLLSVLNAVHTPNLQIATHFYSTAMQFSGKYPKDSVVLYLFETTIPAVISSKKSLSNEMLIGLDSEDVDIVLNKESTVYVLSVERDLFFKIFYHRFSMIFTSYREHNHFIIEGGRVQELMSGWRAWINYLSNEELKMTFEYRYESVEEDILNYVFDFLLFEEKMSERNKFKIATVKKVLDNSLEKPVSIVSLSKELSISERQLHNAFKVKYGLTPKKYLSNLRLNAINIELIEANKGEVTIADIAFKYGFNHVSHFTSEYKKLFGQTPSSTLERTVK